MRCAVALPGHSARSLQLEATQGGSGLLQQVGEGLAPVCAENLQVHIWRPSMQKFVPAGHNATCRFHSHGGVGDKAKGL